MSLTLDYVTMAPKSQEASQIQVNEITRLEQETQQNNEIFQGEVAKQAEQTNRKEKPENETLKNKQREKQRENLKKKTKKGNSNADEKAEAAKKHFDMFI